MWIKQSTYIALEKQVSAQGTTIEWLRTRINQLERRNADLEGKIGIPPTTGILQIERAAVEGVMATPAQIQSARPVGNVEHRNIEDLLLDSSFEDMGDDRAQAEGVDWDPRTGQLTYR